MQTTAGRRVAGGIVILLVGFLAVGVVGGVTVAVADTHTHTNATNATDTTSTNATDGYGFDENTTVIVANGTAAGGGFDRSSTAELMGNDSEAVGGDVEAGGGGGLFSWPDPWDYTQELIASVLLDLSGGVEFLIDAFHMMFFTLPAPGEASSPETWVSQTSGDGSGSWQWWGSVWVLYWVLVGVLTPAFAALSVIQMTKARNARDRTRTVWRFFVVLFLLGAGWVILAALLHAGNALSMGFAPQGTEFLTSTDETFRFGVGFVLAVFLLAVKQIIVLVGVLIVAVQWFLTFVLVLLWPAFILAWGSGNRFLEGVGIMGMHAFGVLVALKVAQTIVLRFLFELPIDPAEPATLVSVVLIIAGLLVAFVALPVFAIKKAVPRSVVAASGGFGRAGTAGAVGGVIARRAPSQSQLKSRLYGRGTTGGASGGTVSRATTSSVVARSHSRSRAADRYRSRRGSGEARNPQLPRQQRASAAGRARRARTTSRSSRERGTSRTERESD